MQQQAKPSRVWRIVLVMSLAVNLLMLGLIGGAFLRSGGGPLGAFDVRLGALTAALSPKDRREIGDQLRRGPGKPGQSRTERRKAFEDLILVLESQPFDPEALSRIFQSQQERQFELQGRALAAFVVRVTDMTLEERTAFAGRLRESSERRGNRRPPLPNSGG